MDPFFEYIKRERTNLSQKLYGAHTPAFKEYSRMPKVVLPSPMPLPVSFDSLLLSRRSTREYAPDAVSLQQLSTLLYWGFGKLGERPEHEHGVQRPHPSGGAKYPVELYPVISNVQGVEAGAYHYNVLSHTLERLPQETDRSVLERVYRYDFVAESAVLLCLSSIKSRQIAKYGAFSYKLGFLEAGHVGQNLYLVSNALDLGCCALGSGDTIEMHEMLGIDGGNEHLVYALAVGKRA